MKKLLTLLLAVCLTFGSALSLTSCGNKEDSVDNRPILKVGMECAYPPYNWTQIDNSNGAVPIAGKNNQYANGYDVKIAKKIADALNMKLEIHAYKWESLVPAVESGTLDLIIAGMSPTGERAEVIDFSHAYYESNLVVVVRKDGAYANATSIADLANAKIVAQAGTFHDEVVDQIPNVQHQTPLEDFNTMQVALNAKTVDGYVAEEPGAIADCDKYSDFTYVHLVNNSTGFHITDLSNITLAVGVKKGSALLEQINEVIDGITLQERENLMAEARRLAKEQNL